jgi:citrate lyase subunit beta / citryl-CoA lyase
VNTSTPTRATVDDARTRSNRQIPAEISRSWLLVSANDEERFDRAARSRADQVVLDVEDAVDPARKPAARATVAAWLAGGGEAWVRVNDVTTDFWGDDLEALRGLPGLLGVMLAKTEGADHVTDTWHRLGGQTPVVALVESALGIENASSIAKAKGAFRLAFGSGDYRRDTGTSADTLAMAYPRSKLVVASRIGDLPGPIDGPTVGSAHAILREQSQIAVSLGLTGKLCLDTDQLPVINEVISPTSTDVAWAQDFLDDFDVRGKVIRDGSDLPRVGRAEKIMRLATAFGVAAE